MADLSRLPEWAQELWRDHVFAATLARAASDDDSRSSRVVRLCEYAAEQQQRAEEAEDRLAEIREQNRMVLEGRCPSDEVHCGCVPVLRAEIERLKSMIAKAYDELDYGCTCGPEYTGRGLTSPHCIGCYVSDGLTILREALGSEGTAENAQEEA